MPIKLRLRRPAPDPGDRYHSDAAYRDRAKTRGRRAYRTKVDGFELENCLVSLKFIAQAAEVKPCQIPGGGTKKLTVLTMTKTAGMLQKMYSTLHRWIKDGRIPAPVLSEAGSRGNAMLYHVEEVRAMIRIIGKHESEVRYYRGDHTDIRNQVAKAVAEVRKAYGIV
jgi:hypothetical protein